MIIRLEEVKSINMQSASSLLSELGTLHMVFYVHKLI